MPSKRKGTSFQITSVSVNTTGNTQQQQQQRASADNNNGDDSADDLDESHTDDNISRITDYETPSFSEDTFSREDVFFAQPNAFGTAPVIPTSSQYGLAIVGPDLGGNGSNMSDVHVSVSDAGINIMGQIPNKQDVDHKNERFKVVKIESTEPFKRGRWMCMDYLDHTTLQVQDDGIDGTLKDEVADENAVRTKDSGLESGYEGNDSMIDNGDMEHINDNDGCDQEVLRAEMMNHHHHLDFSMSTNHHQLQTSHHTMTSIPTHHSEPPTMQNMQAQSMPQGHFDQIISHPDLSEAKMEISKPSQTDTLPSQQQTLAGGNHQNHPGVDNSQHHAQTLTPDMIQRSLHETYHSQQQQQFHHQGVTLPANILMQNIGHEQHHQQSQNQLVNNASNQATPIPTQIEESQDSVTSQFQSQQIGTGDNKQQSNESDQQQQQLSGNVSTNDNVINNSVSDSNNINSNDGGTQNVSSPSSSAGLGTVAEGGVPAVVSSSVSEVNSNVNIASATAGDDGQSLNEDSER